MVAAELQAKGKSVLPKALDVKRIMGEGSFGQVFEVSGEQHGKATEPGTERGRALLRSSLFHGGQAGQAAHPLLSQGSVAGPLGPPQRVVVKRVKTRVEVRRASRERARQQHGGPTQPNPTHGKGKGSRGGGLDRRERAGGWAGEGEEEGRAAPAAGLPTLHALPAAQGAAEMGQMEHLLNVYASRVARGHCADFVGYCEVAEHEATPKLTPGLWLVRVHCAPLMLKMPTAAAVTAARGALPRWLAPFER